MVSQKFHWLCPAKKKKTGMTGMLKSMAITYVKICDRLRFPYFAAFLCEITHPSPPPTEGDGYLLDERDERPQQMLRKDGPRPEAVKPEYRADKLAEFAGN